MVEIPVKKFVFDHIILYFEVYPSKSRSSGTSYGVRGIQALLQEVKKLRGVVTQIQIESPDSVLSQLHIPRKASTK